MMMGFDRYWRMAAEVQRQIEQIARVPIHDIARSAEAHRELVRASGLDTTRSLEVLRDATRAFAPLNLTPRSLVSSLTCGYPSY